jgi:15-cis-phytoene synthase
MDDPEEQLPPPLLLAIAHAPPDLRDRLGWLLRFDQRLAQLVERASEPLIAQLRLAWWRDALAKDAGERPKGEPLLASLIDDAALIIAAQQLVDAAELRVADDPATAALERGNAMCQAFAKWTGVEPQVANRLAAAWAGEGALSRFPRSLRPLTLLVMAERLEATPDSRWRGLRLIWHGLTGR